jgi:hypothetical protein
MREDQGLQKPQQPVIFVEQGGKVRCHDACKPVLKAFCERCPMRAIRR